MNNPNIKKTVVMAMLIAIAIVLTRVLSITTPIVRIDFGFIAIVMMAVLYGPIFAGVGAAIADVLGVTLLSPFPLFPGFTLTAFLMGVVYGLFLYNRPKSLWRICAAVIIITIGLQFVLDSFWLWYFIWDYGFLAIVGPRVLRTIVMTAAQLICIRFMVSEKFSPVFRTIDPTFEVRVPR